jgi:general secretion pathway protein D
MTEVPMKTSKRLACWSFTLSLLLLSGCATETALREARSTFEEGRYEESLDGLSRALERHPTNPQLRTAYLGLRERSLLRVLTAAEEARLKNNVQSAKDAYQRALVIDRNNIRAHTGLQELARMEKHAALLEKAKTHVENDEVAASSEYLRAILSENADHAEAKALLQELKSKSAKSHGDSGIVKALQKTLSIDFKDAMLKQVFEVFARTTSVNFVFDKDVRTDQKVTVFLKGTSVKEALDVVLFTNQLEQRALDTNTILIYPNVPAKLEDYQSLTIRGFFLEYADPEQVANALRSLLKMKDVITDKRQNSVTVRDTPEAVKLAQKLVTLMDLPEPEVMLEVEILEVNRNRLTELGIKYPSQLTLTPLADTAGGAVTVEDLRSLNSSTVGASVSPVIINAKRQTADINLLANPRIRARNRETAKILIGDKVPNITTTSTATGFVSTNVQYLDVGLKLEVVPTITADNEVAIKIALEVSNIANQIVTSEGTVAYQIGTRSASTVLRLKDGENQVLAGLINDEDRHSANKVPGLGDLPLLGRLFSSNLQEGKKTEIVLSITPRIVRNSLRPALAVIEFDSGTEAGRRSVANGSPRPTSKAETATPAEATKPADSSLSLPPAPAPEKADTSAVPPATPTLQWNAPDQVKTGETFTLTLNMSTGQPITGVPLAIAFEPAKLEIVAVKEGTLLGMNNGVAAFNHRVDRASGHIYATGTRNAKNGDNTGATGEGTLVSITMRAIGNPGPATVRLTTVAPIGLNGASVPANVPAPLTIQIAP